ncbi:MAG: hypothetical protein QGF30_05045 [Alphaproteobacteria bacterium]|jgi:acyl carrier protein|nr:hypothetical protein [Alphaproteobacteria bacterium]|tara:strand:- start:385 stop:612 length:228 start_codon:yes stop_codon:yes gene_type:complete
MSETEKIIAERVQKVIKEEEFDVELNDSLDKLELIMSLEQEFDLHLDNIEAEFNEPDDYNEETIIRIIQKKIKNK